MKHIEVYSAGGNELNDKQVISFTGRYYTDIELFDEFVVSVVESIKQLDLSHIRIIDPFAGDLRLLYGVIAEYTNRYGSHESWEVHAWDLSSTGFDKGKEKFNEIDPNIELELIINECDSFCYNQNLKFDVVVTNPPWENIKPDNRELESLTKEEKQIYLRALKKFDSELAVKFPYSQPSSKFGGWGTNLSRVGLELSIKLIEDSGVLCVFMPASFIADSRSLELRKFMFNRLSVKEISFLPAEMKLYGKADTTSICIIASKCTINDLQQFRLKRYYERFQLHEEFVKTSNSYLRSKDFIIPISTGWTSYLLLEKFSKHLINWAVAEKLVNEMFFCGREKDETGWKTWTNMSSETLFIKGRNVERYKLNQSNVVRVNSSALKKYRSSQYYRIGWRDISRPSQKRRVVAAIVPAGVLTGNSVNICYFSDSDEASLNVLLSVINSTVFEFQVKTFLATTHISLSAMRRTYLPTRKTLIDVLPYFSVIDYDSITEDFLSDSLVAKYIYKISVDEYESILRTFMKFSDDEIRSYLRSYEEV